MHRVDILLIALGAVTAWTRYPVMASGAMGTPDLRPIQHKFVEQGVREERAHIRSIEQWRTFWRRFSEEEAPTVDFARNDVVIVLMGTQGSSGYSVHIGHVKSASAGVRVELLFCAPPRDSTQLTVVTSPYDLTLIPKVNGTVMWLVQKGQTGRPPCTRGG